MFQSTPPHGGATHPATKADHQEMVSIHAPARGGDDTPLCAQERPSVSIHAPARGGDPGDQDVPGSVRVSIHAPARGGDGQSGHCWHGWEVFQSTPPHGGRLRCPLLDCTIHCFNPRPRTGGRRTGWPIIVPTTTFQSTPPHGGATRVRPAHVHRQRVSIHAPARGATLPARDTGRRAGVSIHAPARGGD